MTEAQSPQGVLTGRHVFLMFLAFFGAVIATNVVFVRLAVSSFPGEEVKKSYYQGLHYNEVLEARAAQDAVGWSVVLVSQPAALSNGALRLKLVDSSGAPVDGATLTGSLVRPATGLGEALLSFEPQGGGVYASEPLNMERGAWKLSVDAVSTADASLSASAHARLLVP